MSGGVQRKLTTIVAADIAGFTQLVGLDEEGTLAAQRSHRAELVDPFLAQHNGRIANTAGDSFLFEFPSAVEAVRFSVALQEGMAAINLDVPVERRIEYRIGINVGDVVVDGDDLLGDGVNIAARLESICRPGGILLSDDAYRQVRDRLEVPWEDGGAHEVKNIARPVQVWRWMPAASSEQSEAPQPDQMETAPLPDKPSIAVLPFDNMSGDPEQEYFSDGICEDIITTLSRFHQFFVIARNSSFTYKHSAVDVKQVARELGVQYVLEGSLRRAGNRVRITAQLIDAPSDHHLWAERYDRELDDIFAIQDEITQQIVTAVAPELQLAEMVRARRKTVPELGVWQLVARSMWHIAASTADDSTEAEALLKKALAIDPQNADVLSALGQKYAFDALYSWHRPPPDSLTLAAEMSQNAVKLDGQNEIAQTVLGFVLLLSKQHDEAIRRLETAIQLNPNYSPALGWLGVTEAYAHRHETVLDHLEQAIKLSPKDPTLSFFVAGIGYYHFIQGRYDEACLWAEKALHENLNSPTGYRLLATAQGMRENLTEARAAYEKFERLTPGVTVANCVQGVPFAFPDDAERFAEGLRRAGMPDE